MIPACRCGPPSTAPAPSRTPRPAAVRDHCRSLRPDHAPAVVRAGRSAGRRRLVGMAEVAPVESRAGSRLRHRRHRVRRGGARRRGGRARHHASHAATGARRRCSRSGCRFIAGDMTSLPFRPAAFDLVTTGYGLRNVPDLDAAIDEIARVLRPGGRLLSLDFNRPESPVVRAAYLAYLTVVGSDARLAPAPRPRHLSLHSRVDPQVSGRRGRGRPAVGGRLRRRARRGAAGRPDDAPCGAAGPRARQERLTA